MDRYDGSDLHRHLDKGFILAWRKCRLG